MDLYSASVLDLDTVACFLALQEIRLAPRNIAKPPVDLRSSMLPAQSASENALNIIELDFCMCKPSPTECFTYLIILLTAVQCKVVGA